MYFWKCWRESRTQFIIGLVVFVALCILFTYPAARIGTPDLMRRGVRPTTGEAWSLAPQFALGGWGVLLSLVWGLVLGSVGVGKEFDKQTADFLLTRPRRRRYWVWVGWPAGLAELIGIVLAAVGATCAVLVFLTRQFYSWRLFAAIPGLAIGGAVAYGLTYFMTLVTRSSRRGLSYAVGILLIAILLPGTVGFFWKIHLPSLWEFMETTCQWAGEHANSFPFGGLILWALVALVFLLAAQTVVEHADM